MLAAAPMGVLVVAEPDRHLLAAGRHAGRVAHLPDSQRSGRERTFQLHDATHRSLYRSPRGTVGHGKLRRTACHQYDGVPRATVLRGGEGRSPAAPAPAARPPGPRPAARRPPRRPRPPPPPRPPGAPRTATPRR